MGPGGPLPAERAPTFFAPAVPVSLLPGDKAYNLDILESLLLAASDEARAAQLTRQRLESDGTAPVVLKALQQTAGLVKVGVKLALK